MNYICTFQIIFWCLILTYLIHNQKTVDADYLDACNIWVFIHLTTMIQSNALMYTSTAILKVFLTESCVKIAYEYRPQLHWIFFIFKSSSTQINVSVTRFLSHAAIFIVAVRKSQFKPKDGIAGSFTRAACKLGQGQPWIDAALRKGID